ncbi:hypothetical protein GGR56DRAFT_644813 [Xylariaceae sp. FL0804]|nr:hypothetical protein GGR56DRAFT_644813 [Xylariaceae sp. FL0804]
MLPSDVLPPARTLQPRRNAGECPACRTLQPNRARRSTREHFNHTAARLPSVVTSTCVARLHTEEHFNLRGPVQPDEHFNLCGPGRHPTAASTCRAHARALTTDRRPGISPYQQRRSGLPSPTQAFSNPLYQYRRPRVAQRYSRRREEHSRTAGGQAREQNPIDSNAAEPAATSQTSAEPSHGRKRSVRWTWAKTGGGSEGRRVTVAVPDSQAETTSKQPTHNTGGGVHLRERKHLRGFN